MPGCRPDYFSQYLQISHKAVYTYKELSISVWLLTVLWKFGSMWDLFDMVPPNILVSNLGGHGFDGYTVWQIKNWLDGHMQTVVINGSMPKWLLLRVHIRTGTVFRWASSMKFHWVLSLVTKEKKEIMVFSFIFPCEETEGCHEVTSWSSFL